MRRLTEVIPGIFVATSDLYTTTTTVVRGRDDCALIIDPAVTTADLAELVAELAEAGLRPVAGFSTHPHWDHVLWCAALGEVPRYASPRTAEVTERERSGLLDSVRREAPGHDLELFGRVAPLGQTAAGIPWPGPAALVVTHDGHAPGHSAVFLPASGTLIAGDMCSDIEIPLLDLDQADPLGDYRTGLGRLAELQVRHVIPGHGHVGDAAEFRRRVAADHAYLDALQGGAEVTDPRLMVDWLVSEHARQAERLRS